MCAHAQHCLRKGVGWSWCVLTQVGCTQMCVRINRNVRNVFTCGWGITLATPHLNGCMEEVGCWVFLGFHSKSERLSISYHSTYQNVSS